MSPHGQEHVSSLVHDLVEMAEATRRLPELVAENDRLREQSVADGARIVRLEQKLIDRANEIDALYTKLRSVEAERDDAGFRLLEAEDKATATERALGDMQATLGALISAIRKVEPQAELQQEPVEPVVPMAEPIPTSTATGAESSSPTVNEGSADIPVGVSGQSESDTIVPPENVDTPTSADSEASVSQPKPYEGRYYIDVPGWISREDWLAGGGTNRTYDYRHRYGTNG